MNAMRESRLPGASGNMASSIGVCCNAEEMGRGRGRWEVPGYSDIVTKYGKSHSNRHLDLE